MAFLQPQDPLGLHPEGDHAELFASRHQALPHSEGAGGWTVDLEGEFAGKAEAHQATGHARHFGGANPQVRKGLVGKIAPGQLLQHGPGLRSAQVEGGEGLGQIEHVHPLAPARLHPPLDPLEDTGRTGRGGGYVPLFVAKMGPDPVVQHHAFVVAHDAVAHPSRAEPAPGIGVEPFQQIRRTRAGELQLAQGAHVDQADPLAHGPHLGDGVAVVFGPQPEPGHHHPGAALLVPRVDRGHLHGLHALAGQRAQLHRHDRGPRSRLAHLRPGLAPGVSGKADGVGRAHLALARAHRNRAVALEQLAALVPLGHGGFQILVGDILAEAHEALALAGRARPHRGTVLLADRGRACTRVRRRPQTAERRGPGPGQAPLLHLRVHGALPADPSGQENSSRQGFQRFALGGPGPGHVRQIRGRGPAGAGGDQVAGDGLRRALVHLTLGGQPGDHCAMHRAPALGPQNGVLAEDWNRVQPARVGTTRPRPLVDQGRHGHAGRHQIGGHLPTLVIDAHHHGPLAGHHAEEVEQALHRAPQHHARQIIVAEEEGPFIDAGRQHQSAGPNLEQALTPHRGQPVVLVPAEDTGFGEHRDLRLLEGVEQPGQDRGPAGREAEMTARGWIRVEEQHPGPRPGRGQGRADPGRASTDHDHVAVQVLFVEFARGGVGMDSAQTGGSAQEALVEWPQNPGPDESLVVKAHRQEPGHQPGQGEQIPLERGPGILRAHLHARFHRPLAGAHIGLVAHLHQAVGAVPGCAEQPARAVVLEGTAEDLDPGRGQGRGNGIARVGAVLPAVEREPDED